MGLCNFSEVLVVYCAEPVAAFEVIYDEVFVVVTALRVIKERVQTYRLPDLRTWTVALRASDGPLILQRD